MSYTTFKGKFLSTNKKDFIKYYICEPETDFRAVLHFVHGWGDSFRENEELIEYFTSHGILVCGCDYIGDEIGYEEEHVDFNRLNAWNHVVKDLQKLSRYIKKTYPDLPIYFYGHGLGSLLVRMATFQKESYDGLILSGTSGTPSVFHRSAIGLKMVKMWSKLDSHSPLLKYIKEREPGYTKAALWNMSCMMAAVSSKNWYLSMEENMPVLLLSGKKDPVGNFGKGIAEIKRKLKRNDRDVTSYLYDDMHHDILKEQKENRVFDDMLYWMKKYIEE